MNRKGLPWSRTISDYLSFFWLTDVSLASESLATRSRTEFEKENRVSVRPAPLDRNLSSGSALLCNKWVLGPFTPKETTDYPHAVLGGSIVDPMKLSDSLFSKTFGYGYFLVFISREQRHYDAGPIVNAVSSGPPC